MRHIQTPQIEDRCFTCSNMTKCGVMDGDLYLKSCINYQSCYGNNMKETQESLNREAGEVPSSLVNSWVFIDLSEGGKNV